MVIERLSKKHKTDKEEAQIGLLHGLKKFFVFFVSKKSNQINRKTGNNYTQFVIFVTV